MTVEFAAALVPGPRQSANYRQVLPLKLLRRFSLPGIAEYGVDLVTCPRNA